MVWAIRKGVPLLDWMPLLQGLFAASLILMAGQGLARFGIISILAACLGIMLTAAGADGNTGNAIFYAALGMAFLVSGGLTFRNYMRQAPPEKQP